MRIAFSFVLVVLLMAGFGLDAAAQSYGGGSTGVRSNVRIQYYDIEGRSDHDLLQGMVRQGPSWQGRRYFGLTTTEVQYAYSRAPKNGGCVLEDIVVTLDITITMPRWNAPNGTPFALERAWRTFERNLLNHENGHRQLAEAEGHEILQALQRLRAPSCDVINDDAQRAAQRIRDMHENQHRNYDARTEHGRTQGANWPQGR